MATTSPSSSSASTTTSAALRAHIYPLATAPPPPFLLALLELHLPHSLPLLRRLQFALRFPSGGWTPWSHVVFVGETAIPNSGEEAARRRPFAAAYVDLSRGPETQCWPYATLEDRANVSAPLADGLGGDDDEALAAGATETEVAQLGALLDAFRRMVVDHAKIAEAVQANGPRLWPETSMLLGALHVAVRAVLERRCGAVLGFRDGVPDERWVYAKWLIPVAELPGVDVDAVVERAVGGLRENGGGRRWCWDSASAEDVKVVLSRTSIPRQE